MKKILLSFAVISATLFASCSKDTDTINTELTAPVQGSVVNLSFKTLDSQTRTSLDEVSSVKEWEKTINHIDLFVFSSSDELIIRKKYNSAEVATGGNSFALPNVSAGDNLRLVAIANFDLDGSIATEEEALSALTTHDITEYNGSYDEVSTSALRSGGFVFKAVMDHTVAAPGEPNNITLSLERLVSKFAIESAFSFTNIENTKFVGAVVVDNIEFVDDSNTNTPIQNAASIDNKFYNLFYITPFKSSGTFDIRMNIIYDADGDFATTEDQDRYSITKTLYRNSFADANKAYKYRFSVETSINYGPDMSLTLIDWNIRDIDIIEGDWYVDVN